MYTADPKLCEELYKLSGWTHPVVLVKFGIPLYDLGYLLRKLPAKLGDSHLLLKAHKNRDYKEATSEIWWSCGIESTIQNADTPEDAACNLAISLFKQGLLAKEDINE